MAGIAFPVIIHLWNNKQGKVLRIGSIALLEKRSRRQARSNRISEWWLLLLRCLLLLLLALLLSGPSWRIESNDGKTKGWILGTKAATQGSAYKALTDSLLKVGYEWHEWKDRDYWGLFRAADHEAPATLPFYIFTDRRRTAFIGERPVCGRTIHWFTTTPAPDTIHHWIGQAWLCYPDSIRVLTGNSRLTGNVYSYQMLPAKAGTTQSPVASDVRPVQKDSFSNPFAKSSPVSPVQKGFLNSPVTKDSPVSPVPKNPDGRQETYQVKFSNGRLWVALDSQPPVIVDTTPLRILIYADPTYNNDSRYVAGAMRAWQQFTRQNIRVIITSSFPDPASSSNPAPQPDPASNRASQTSSAKGFNTVSHFDWIFWLSSTAPPADLPARTILSYEPGREMPVDTWIQDLPAVALSRRIEPDFAGDSNKEVCWKDGFGRPLLTLETRSGQRIFHFLSHFDPSWNGLVWNPRFPLLLENLLTNPVSLAASDLTEGNQDLRVLDPEQITPPKSLAGNLVNGKGSLINGTDNIVKVAGSTANLSDSEVKERRQPKPAIDLTPVCWVLILLVFVGERILTYRSPKIKTDG